MTTKSFSTNLQTAYMPFLERLCGTRFWSLYRESLRDSQLADQVQAERQRRKVEYLVRHATRHVPFWRQRIPTEILPIDFLSTDAWSRFFGGLPVTTKAELKSGFPDQVTSDTARENWRFGSSAGTVDRVIVVSDFRKRDYFRATNLRIMDAILGSPLGSRIVDIPPDACNVVCALRDEGPLELFPFAMWAFKKGILFKPETRPDLRGRIERTLLNRQDTFEPLAIKSFDDLKPQLDQQLNRMLAVKPNLLRGLPLFLLWLGERAVERRLQFPSLKAILPYGGLMSQAMANRVSEAMGVPFHDYYGTSEFGGVAMQYTQTPGMQVFSDLVLVEIVDDNYQPLPPGQSGRILITDFHNYAMPLIRYQVGDRGCWISDTLTTNDQFQLCRQAKLLVLGRQVETAHLASGREVSAREILDTLFADRAIVNACVECRDGFHFTLKYAANGTISPTTLDVLHKLLEATAPIRVRQVPYLRPESSGKFQYYKQLSNLKFNATISE